MVVFNELNSWIGLYARLSFFVMFSIISRGVSAGLPTATAPNLAIKIKKESVPACFFSFFLAKRECRGRPHNRRDTYIIITPVAGRAGWWRGIKWDKRRGDIHVARVAAKCRLRGLVACDKRGVNVGATFMSPGWRAHACGRLRCLPAVGRASQVAPLRLVRTGAKETCRRPVARRKRAAMNRP